ncbi:hypothetical protein [Halalkalibacter alkalisediminis]|uniref:Uncharacterized protein n=1 Tax=Halalkalibacter alkalisediminis TaxID=935616 RepID=A0ABV6NCU6_9BACI|nr:hypothetical protein [Halalkalibacter alkalisediminis]
MTRDISDLLVGQIEFVDMLILDEVEKLEETDKIELMDFMTKWNAEQI